MAGGEDPATVLEQWIHDTANLPAEITHLFEEAEAKEREIQLCRLSNQTLDAALQKFAKLNGVHVPNPKEERDVARIRQNYERMEILQAEKTGLIEKAILLTDRNVKKLDVKLRDLQSDGSIPTDPQLPSLLKDSTGNMVPPPSLTNTGANTPLPALSNHGGGAPNLAQAAMARLNSATSALNRQNVSAQSMQQQALENRQRLMQSQSANQAAARQERELSVGSDGKRRRPTGSVGPLPQGTSGLGRQASLGPGTPKPSAPGSRAGSVGPRLPQKQALTIKKTKPPQPLRKAALTGNKSKRRKGSSRASPSTTAEDESAASDAGSDDEMTGVGAAEEGDEEADDTKYCFCQRVSFGDMVACDNDNCKYQWFHWECVSIKEEPVGDWLCPDCRKQPKNKISKGTR